MDTINERVRMLRKKLHLTQKEFGKKLGVSQTAIGQYEAGTRTITARTILQLCQLFNVNDTWIRSGEGNMFITNNDPISEIVSQYNLNIDSRALLESFLSLSNEQRSHLLIAAELASERAKALRQQEDEYDAETERLLEQLRREREAEKRGVQESLHAQSEKRA